MFGVGKNMVEASANEHAKKHMPAVTKKGVRTPWRFVGVPSHSLTSTAPV